MRSGAVALGYGHPAVNARRAANRGGRRGRAAPVLEEELADALAMRSVARASGFLKTGAERWPRRSDRPRATGRDRVLGCGYHGWLDWSQGGESAATTRALYAEYRSTTWKDPAPDPRRGRSPRRCRRRAVVGSSPRAHGSSGAEEATRVGAVLVSTRSRPRFGWRSAARRALWRSPDLRVGQAIANGFSTRVVGGRAPHGRCGRTWISSTLATESVALAAAQATFLELFAHEDVCGHLHGWARGCFTGSIACIASHADW